VGRTGLVVMPCLCQNREPLKKEDKKHKQHKKTHETPGNGDRAEGKEKKEKENGRERGLPNHKVEQKGEGKKKKTQPPWGATEKRLPWCSHVGVPLRRGGEKKTNIFGGAHSAKHS